MVWDGDEKKVVKILGVLKFVVVVFDVFVF